MLQQFGELRLLKVRSDPVIVDERVPAAGNSGHDALVFLFTVSGTVDRMQHGQSTRLPGGSGIFYHSGHPSTMSYPEASQLHILEVPRAIVADSVSGFSHLANLDLRPVSELFPLATAYVAQLAARSGSLDSYSAARISDNLSDLICAMLADAARRAPLPLSECKTAALMRVRMYVDEHLANPDLRPADVAQALRLSTRYINHLLQAQSTSLERLIRHRRLERIAADLRDPAKSKHSISMIALSRGFSDLSHFSTVFRRLYGVSPREHRNS
jgi:AraC-like DNA-binding protein